MKTRILILAAALGAAPALATHGSTSASLSTVDVTAELDDYQASVTARANAARAALNKAAPQYGTLSTTARSTYTRTQRAINQDLAQVNRLNRRLPDASSPTARVDLQADIEAAFARMAVRFEHLGASAPQLATALSGVISSAAETRARAAETFDPAESASIAGVSITPRSVWTRSAVGRLSAIENRIDRIERQMTSRSSTTRAAMRDAAYDLRADLRQIARRTAALDDISARSEQASARSEIDDMVDALESDVASVFDRWGVR